MVARGVTGRETASRRLAIFVAGLGVALRLAGTWCFLWWIPVPAVARQCLEGLGLQIGALVLAVFGRQNLALVAVGADLLRVATLTPRFGTGSMLFLFAMVQPFLGLALTRWPLWLRILLAAFPPAAFGVVRLTSYVPPDTGLLASEQLRDLATFSVLSFIVLGMTITVSTLRGMEGSLRRTRELAEARSRLIDDMSHELRTPVSTTLTAAQLALARARTGESYRDTLRVIERQARALGLIVGRMLELGRAERAEVEGSAADGLADAVRRTVDAFRDMATARGVSLDLVTEAVDETTDAGIVHIVLGNLLSNAIRFSPEAGRVEILVAADGAGPFVRLRDHGPGIAKEDLPHVFERYWRADKARTRRHGEGTVGLGLSIARRYAALVGAAIEVESTPGRGATFTVRW